MKKADGNWLISQNKIRELIGRRMEEVSAIVGAVRATEGQGGEEGTLPPAAAKHSFSREELGLGKVVRA